MRYVLVLILVSLAPAAWAQQDPALAAAVRLAAEGRSDSARALVRAKLSTVTPPDPLYAEATYTAGVVSDNTDSALGYFRRVTIEHSGSDWADDALLRMAQIMFAQGQLRSAIRSADRILNDYPFSEVHASAAYWGGRSRVELGEMEEGCRLLRAAEAAARTNDSLANVELANRAKYFLQRCVADTAIPDEPERRRAANRAIYSVQLAAFSSAASADEFMQRISREGYEPRVVREDGLLKVRVGRFSSRAPANQLVAELRRKFGGTPFVVQGS